MNALKLIAPPLVALFLGFTTGMLLGSTGKKDLQGELAQAQKSAKETKISLKMQLDACNSRQQRSDSATGILLARIQLLKALAELDKSNYGLASQQLGNARKELKTAGQALGGEAAARLTTLLERIGEAQTETMQLSKKARASIEAILTDLERIPVGR